MWDQRKLVIAGIIVGTVITIAAISFVLIFESKKTAINNNSTVAVVDQSNTDNGNVVTEQPSSGQNQAPSENIPTPIPTPTQDTGASQIVLPTPTPTTAYLAVYGNPSFTDASLTVTSQNNSAGVSTYLSSVSKTTANFDLINDFQTIQNQVQGAIESGNPQDIDAILSIIKQKQTALARVPVPSRVLGLAQNYYLSYGRLHDTLSLLKQYLAAQQDNPQLETQIENSQDDFTAVSDVLNNNYDTAKQIANQ